jgi:soluble lytic murein transglycosylase-like protein
LIQKTSGRYGIPEHILSGLIHAESLGFADTTTTGSSAVGLGQFTKGTAETWGVTDRTDPEQAIEGVGRYMHHLLKKYNGDISTALMAYHEGPERADKIIRLVNSGASREEIISAMATNKATGNKELINYLSNVLALSGEYRGLY